MNLEFNSPEDFGISAFYLIQRVKMCVFCARITLCVEDKVFKVWSSSKSAS